MVAGLDTLLVPLDIAIAAVIAWLMIPLSVYLFLSGLDDLLLDLFSLFHRRRAAPLPPPITERPTAVLIPLWNEHEVIGRMVRHNLGALRYSSYDCFIGVYPNDRKTVHTVQNLATAFPRVHLAVLPHDGPTVKADCLNWAFQHMLLSEESSGIRYENIVIHDAEDVMHPDSLAILNSALATAGMVQLPVLPFATPIRDFTHGVYCDDFAEGQALHLAARVRAGAFLPGCGVGTAFSRNAIEALAAASANRLFDPESLTEDYDVGLRLHQLGFTQTFVPVTFSAGHLVATREFFPRTIRNAIRQRTRWIIGNSLQSWSKHGWGVGPLSSWPNRYFLWRDRKGLWGNPLSLLCNALLLYAVLSWLHGAALGGPWRFAQHLPRGAFMQFLYVANSVLYLERVGVRTWMVASVYGFPTAAFSPLRMLWGNWINCWASSLAILRYARSWVHNQPLRWVKTQHAFPTRAALTVYRRRLGEILVHSNYISQQDLDRALSSPHGNRRLGERLIALGALTEDELYEALSLQSSLPLTVLDPLSIDIDVLRALPGWAIRHHKAIPFRLDRQQLNVATPEPPSDEAQHELTSLSGLSVVFHLVTPANFHALLQFHRVYESFR